MEPEGEEGDMVFCTQLTCRRSLTPSAKVSICEVFLNKAIKLINAKFSGNTEFYYVYNIHHCISEPELIQCYDAHHVTMGDGKTCDDVNLDPKVDGYRKYIILDILNYLWIKFLQTRIKNYWKSPPLSGSG